MNATRLLTALLGTAALAFGGCKPDIDDIGLGGGNLNLGKYVAFGDSYTAGFMNGGLYRTGQETAYPALVAQQIAKAGGSSIFNQPYFAGNGTGYYRLVALPAQLDTLPADAGAIRADFPNTACFPVGTDYYYTKADLQYQDLNNLGVPFLRIGALDLKNLGSTTAAPVTPATMTEVVMNPFFERILPGLSDTTSYLQAAFATAPTVYTAWFGMDDLINYALSGGTCGTQPLPDTTVTTPLLKKLVDQLAAQGAKGAIGNLPRVAEFPYFKLVNNYTLEERARLETGDPNAKVYIGPNQTLNPAQDIVLYSALPGIGLPDANGNLHGFSPLNPLTNAEVLNTVEIGRLNSAASKYNTALGQLQTRRPYVTLVETSPFFTNLNATGIMYAGVTYSSAYLTGEAFSTDGLRLSARGNALLANLFIQRLNEVYNTFIPSLNPNSYPSVQRPG